MEVTQKDKIINFINSIISYLNTQALNSFDSCSWQIQINDSEFTEIKLVSDKKELLFVQFVNEWIDNHDYCRMIEDQAFFKLTKQIEQREESKSKYNFFAAAIKTLHTESKTKNNE